MFHWVIKNELARGSRPKYGKKWAQQVPKSTVDKWVTNAKTAYGIRSVICLLDEKQLRFYEQLPLGLVSYYRENGIAVEHVPVRLQSPLVLTKKQRQRIWLAYERLPKPLLIHCSAGIGRSRKAASHIKRQLMAGVSDLE